MTERGVPKRSTDEDYRVMLSCRFMIYTTYAHFLKKSLHCTYVAIILGSMFHRFNREIRFIGFNNIIETFRYVHGLNTILAFIQEF